MRFSNIPQGFYKHYLQAILLKPVPRLPCQGFNQVWKETQAFRSTVAEWCMVTWTRSHPSVYWSTKPLAHDWRRLRQTLPGNITSIIPQRGKPSLSSSISLHVRSYSAQEANAYSVESLKIYVYHSMIVLLVFQEFSILYFYLTLYYGRPEQDAGLIKFCAYWSSEANLIKYCA